MKELDDESNVLLNHSYGAKTTTTSIEGNNTLINSNENFTQKGNANHSNNTISNQRNTSIRFSKDHINYTDDITNLTSPSPPPIVPNPNTNPNPNTTTAVDATQTTMKAKDSMELVRKITGLFYITNLNI